MVLPSRDDEADHGIVSNIGHPRLEACHGLLELEEIAHASEGHSGYSLVSPKDHLSYGAVTVWQGVVGVDDYRSNVKVDNLSCRRISKRSSHGKIMQTHFVVAADPMPSVPFL